MPTEYYPMEEDWNYLIILDACRYDYFEDLYGDYFEGELRKVHSPGSATSEWCRKVFTEKYDDVVYVSGNPRINSRVEVRGFDASKHFHEVVDVWDWGWDEELGTIPPETINESALRAKQEHAQKRFIIHYMQPHAPYIPFEYEKQGSGPGWSWTPKEQERKARLYLIRNFMRKLLIKIFGLDFFKNLRERISPAKDNSENPIERVVKELGVKGFRKMYEENLKIVLDHSSNLIDKLDGKIIVTSDHGEMLGNKKFRRGHESGLNISALREVPYLIIRK